MSAKRRAVAVIGSLAVFVGGCAAAAHIAGLQPPPVKSKLTITLPNNPKLRKVKMQLGLDVLWYAWRSEDVSLQAAETVSYAHSLNANAIGISFPFFVNGQDGTQVSATTQTPTPKQLAILIKDAQKLDMSVSLRPLLGNGSIGRSRTGWVPSNETAFFQSYEKFMKPYLILAQDDGVQEFIEGAELAAFDTAPGWGPFSTWAKTLFHGPGRTLACAANFSNVPSSICGGITETVDAYPPVTHGSLLSGWEAYDKTLKKGTALTEVGIAAAPQAAAKPFEYSWPEAKPDPKEQAKWFTAACEAAAKEHLSGIYFWHIGMGPQSPGPTLQNELNWTNSQGAGAIRACYAHLERIST